MIDNRRKVNEAMTLLTAGAQKLNSMKMGGSDRNMKPRVMSLTSNSFKMGDLTAKNTKFCLRATPRVNKIQAALFTDKRQ